MSEESTKTKKTRLSTKYPKFTLSECIELIQKIREVSGSNELSRIILAKSLNHSPSSSDFRRKISSSNSYGLIQGNEKSDTLGISPLGIKILSTDDDEQKNAIIEAIYNISLFKNFIERYKGKTIPAVDLLMDVFEQEFKLKKQDCEVFYEILTSNLRDFQLLENVKGKDYLYIDNIAVDLDSILTKTDGEKDVDEGDKDFHDYQEEIIEPTPTDIPVVEEPESRTPKIFISHSKNFTILDQIKSIVEAFKDVQVHKKSEISYLVAIDEAKTSKPIPTEIFEMMRKCNCAIINVSLDKENIHTAVVKDKDGNKKEETIYKINPNVLIEIGSAYYGYEERVILIVDKRLKDEIPSNLQGLFYHYYEGEELGHDATMKLFKAIAKFFEKED